MKKLISEVNFYVLKWKVSFDELITVSEKFVICEDIIRLGF